MPFKQAIVDCDPLIYKCGFSIESYNKETDTLEIEPLKHAIYNLNSIIRKIHNKVNAEDYKFYLTSSDKSNFRFKLFPEYKANRKGMRKPYYYNELREYCIKYYEAIIAIGNEADDECSIAHCSKLSNNEEWENNSIVCSIDKDFNNIPGWHYNYGKDEIYYISELQALKNFYLQILTGDNSDGIPRIVKGWKKASMIEKLNKCLNEEEMYVTICNEIENLFPEIDTKDLIDLVTLRGRLVWLQRKPNELWKYP